MAETGQARRRQNRIGSVYEVIVPAGYQYVHYAGPGWTLGSLVRVLPVQGTQLRGRDLCELVAGPERYKLDIMLWLFSREERVENVQYCPVTEAERSLPHTRIFVAVSPRSPNGWLVKEAQPAREPYKEALWEHEFSEKYPDVDQRTLTVWDVPGGDLFLYALDKGWEPRDARSDTGNPFNYPA